jgi:hypothetical protein
MFSLLFSESFLGVFWLLVGSVIESYVSFDCDPSLVPGSAAVPILGN